MTQLSNDLSKLAAETKAHFSKEHKHLINGQWVASASGETIEVFDPSLSEVIAHVPRGTQEDVDRAVAAARAALTGPWSKLTPVERERRLLKLADLLEGDGNVFAEIESVNSGRLLAGARAFDVDLSVDYLRYMAGWATKIEGRTYSPSVPYAPGARFFSWSTREPVGVVAGITPWNVPLGQAIWKVAPVLATGCTMILKPAEQTPLGCLRFGELLEQADIPAGVVNIITGYGHEAGAALVNHPGVDKIGFTGSTEVGKIIGEICGRTMKKFTLELGGKSPVIVLPDADLDQVIPGAAMAIYGNHGQNCCAGSRLFVHKSIFDKVVAGVSEIAKNIKLGSGLSPDAEMGPLVSKQQQSRVLGYIQSGRDEGAEVAAGGEALDHPGAYVKPTVLVKTENTMKVAQEEIFGPVLVAMPFETTEEVVQLANATEFGLGASIWSTNINSVHSLAPQIKAGTVWINTHNVLDLAVPFGGVKSSGIGHELGEEAVRHHTALKVHTMALG